MWLCNVVSITINDNICLSLVDHFDGWNQGAVENLWKELEKTGTSGWGSATLGDGLEGQPVGDVRIFHYLWEVGRRINGRCRQTNWWSFDTCGPSGGPCESWPGWTRGVMGKLADLSAAQLATNAALIKSEHDFSTIPKDDVQTRPR